MHRPSTCALTCDVNAPTRSANDLEEAMHTHTDDLEDVIIEPGTRITDDPSQWVIPEALRRQWAQCPDGSAVHKWWDELSSADERLHGKFTPQQLSEMTTLIQRFDKALVNTRHSVRGRTELREPFVGLFSYGLTFEQAAAACNISVEQALSIVLRSQYQGPDSVQPRLEAERLLRTGMPRTQVAQLTGMTVGQVTSWSEALQIPLQSVASLGFPKEIRQAVFDLTDQGMKMAQVRKIIAERWPMYTVNRHTASAWLSRRRRGMYANDEQAVAS